jgi:hypothetical protein
MVTLEGPSIDEMAGTGGELIVDAPSDAPTTIHTSFAAVQVCDMSGPVRVTAIHARAKILNTSGRVDASSFVIDFVGSKGTVVLSAEAEINVKLTSPRFEGTLMAWAQRPVRVFVPQGFQTAFQVLVNRPGDFVCRTEFREKVKHETRGTLHIFTYAGDGTTTPEKLHLRSEHGTVVIASHTDRQSAGVLLQSGFEDYT